MTDSKVIDLLELIHRALFCYGSHDKAEAVRIAIERIQGS